MIVGGKLLALGQKRKSFGGSGGGYIKLCPGGSGGGDIKLCPGVDTNDVEHVPSNDESKLSISSISLDTVDWYGNGSLLSFMANTSFLMFSISSLSFCISVSHLYSIKRNINHKHVKNEV